MRKYLVWCDLGYIYKIAEGFYQWHEGEPDKSDYLTQEECKEVIEMLKRHNYGYDITEIAKVGA